MTFVKMDCKKGTCSWPGFEITIWQFPDKRLYITEFEIFA
jgi:hypothetical protein